MSPTRLEQAQLREEQLRTLVQKRLEELRGLAGIWNTLMEEEQTTGFEGWEHLLSFGFAGSIFSLFNTPCDGLVLKRKKLGKMISADRLRWCMESILEGKTEVTASAFLLHHEGSVTQETSSKVRSSLQGGVSSVLLHLLHGGHLYLVAHHGRGVMSLCRLPLEEVGPEVTLEPLCQSLGVSKPIGLVVASDRLHVVGSSTSRGLIYDLKTRTSQAIPPLQDAPGLSHSQAYPFNGGLVALDLRGGLLHLYSPQKQSWEVSQAPNFGVQIGSLICSDGKNLLAINPSDGRCDVLSGKTLQWTSLHFKLWPGRVEPNQENSIFLLGEILYLVIKDRHDGRTVYRRCRLPRASRSEPPSGLRPQIPSEAGLTPQPTTHPVFRPGATASRAPLVKAVDRISYSYPHPHPYAQLPPRLRSAAAR